MITFIIDTESKISRFKKVYMPESIKDISKLPNGLKRVHNGLYYKNILKP